MADYVMSPEERADLQRILAEPLQRRKHRIGEETHQPRRRSEPERPTKKRSKSATKTPSRKARYWPRGRIGEARCSDG